MCQALVSCAGTAPGPAVSWEEGDAPRACTHAGCRSLLVTNALGRNGVGLGASRWWGGQPQAGLVWLCRASSYPSSLGTAMRRSRWGYPARYRGRGLEQRRPCSCGPCPQRRVFRWVGGRAAGPAGGPRLSLSTCCFPDREAGPGGTPKARGSEHRFLCAERGSVHVPTDQSVFLHRHSGRQA